MADFWIYAVLLAVFSIQDVRGSVSRADLSNFMTSLWNDDVNADTGVHISRQGHTSTSSHTDVASNNLFSNVNEAYYLHRPTYEAFINLLDNYNHHVGSAEVTSYTESREIDAFLLEVSKTSVMQKTLAFLQHKGYAGSSWIPFEAQLREIWFDFYPRHGGTYDSSGFEHVFVGETDSKGVVGFHNWIQFYLQEKSGSLDYMGYIFNKQPNMIGAHFKWLGETKQLGSFMYGTSPEFDMAMFTVCYLTRRNQKCSFSIDGHNVDVQTYDTSHGGGNHLGTAYI